MEGEIENYAKVWIAATASLTYCYFISFNIPKGIVRFLSLIPVFFFLTTLPLNLTTITLGGTTAFFLTWLANFKLILFTFGQGPLSTNPSISLSKFISVACFPIKLKAPSIQNTKSTSSSPEKQTPKSPDLVILMPIKVFLFCVLSALYPHILNIHPKLMLVFYCSYMYLGLELCLVLVAFMIKSLLGLEIEPQFNEPYMSTSLQDFWGRRWNLTVSNILRPTVYNPTKHFFLEMLGKEWAAMPAILTTFTVSGIMHEVIFYYLARVSPTWEVTGFFVLHGVLLALELLVKRVLKDSHRWRLHPLVSGAITVTILVLTAEWLFFPQMLRCNADVRSSQEILALVNCFKSLGKSVGYYSSNFIRKCM